jgi:hypothetical protein
MSMSEHGAGGIKTRKRSAGAASPRNGEAGMALITVFMVLMLASALMVGFFAAIVADQRANGIDRDQTQAYAAAHAGLEKLTSDLASLFMTDYSPSVAQINALAGFPPTIPGFTYTAPGGTAGSGYSVTFTADTKAGPNFGNPVPDDPTGTPITAGPYAGFMGIITTYPVTITARSKGGAEVRLRRELQTVAVPVFQFGVFSETDLTFYAGDDFNFGGRVQTNGNLFLSELTGATLTLADRVTAFKEVVRANLSNGVKVSDVGFTGTVNVIDTTAGGHTRALATTEGSVTGMPGPGQTLLTKPPAAASWTTISTGTYKSNIRNGLTGAKYLSLPLVSQGAQPIDLIRRPPVSEDTTNALVFGQRYFSMASLRILLSDTAAEITNLPTVTSGAPLSLDWGVDGVPAWYTINASHPPMATSPGLMTSGAYTMATASGISSTVVPVASMPAYFKLTTIHVGTNSVTCTARTPTTFTGCGTFSLLAVPSGAGTVVTADVPSGSGTVTVSTTTASGQSSISLGGTNKTLTVLSTAAFAPTTFWLTSPGTRDGGSFTCTGYTTTPSLTGCTGLPATLPATGTAVHTGSLEDRKTLNRGFIKIELQDGATPPVWHDVTTEILKLGFAGPANVLPEGCDPTPDAVIRLEHVRDNPGGVCTANGNSSINSNDYWPNVLYDTREGILRDDPASTTDFSLKLGGIMNYVSLDVANLKKWLAGTTGTTGTTANNQNGAGFIVYFSDRRSNKNQAATKVETGEYGYEDFVNPASATGTPNGTLDTGEDVNAYVATFPAVYTPVFDVYGKFPVNPIGASTDILGNNARPTDSTANQWVGMVNRPIFFRRALKLIHGGNPDATHSNIPAPGLSVAAENPVYVQGNFNATSGNTTDGVAPTETHAACAILADAVTLLSNNWNDNLSFQFPNNAPSRLANSGVQVATGFRFAAVAGKSLSFPYPAAGAPQFLFGTDGGAGNFLRLLEDWTSATIRYRGSIVSLFINRQATGTFKYSTQVYNFGLRKFIFDNDFLLPALLPPGTPMFRDVNTLTFRQLLRPNQ